ncbi:M43 family zinc metalloprotease [Paraflavitalea sp. CAU 1676]|uniref:M43 family zinc metalloprotease n=1 Tax=Paraflavitalea sp. CAU 1676 TaxID=3032598 RepID=UPI0023D9898A|nr:M43 family zinc metalloprotease [Paraflavitalea sp. CAU 1676]MDF2187726.1 M43 family zinc metalloprotease [Paraflavitalea sp. CAU 1676]
MHLHYCRFIRYGSLILLLMAADACRRPRHDPPGPTPPVVIIPDDAIIRIPVIVHVLYNQPDFNISDEKIVSQLKVLNADFRMSNIDIDQVPAEFAHLSADAGIEFVLATEDPEGKATDGIVRVHTAVDGWAGNNPTGTIPVEKLKLFRTADGGSDAWPADRYLNIWIAEMSDRQGKMGLAGYSSYPGADARIDGVVIDPRAFGTLEPLVDGHRLGRTATHEIGHWFNLLHIFGDADDCAATDHVDDTPSTATRYLGHPTYPQNSCGHSNMFMNFMDYVDDESMFFFTKGQRERMRKTFHARGGRHKLYLNCRDKAEGKDKEESPNPPSDHHWGG